MDYTVGILVISDSCSSKLAVDTSGLNLKDMMSKEFHVSAYDIVPDNIEQIKNKLIDWSDNLKLNLILTTGGTGLAPTDVTPEATRSILDTELPSLTNAILIESLKITKFAMLSRAIAGRRNKTLILNLPGSKKGSSECLTVVFPILKHALSLINENFKDVKTEHAVIQQEKNLNTSNNSHTAQYPHHCEHHKHKNNEYKSKVGEADMLSKPRKSEYPMIPVDEALKIIMNNSDFHEIEKKMFMDALNYISAEDIHAKEPLPPFRASVKDGFAVKLHSDYKMNETVTFNVIGASNAGDSQNVWLNEGECIKINTGAYVPLSANAVVQIEDTISVSKNEIGEDTQIKVIDSNIKIDQDIRPIGFDIKKDEIVVKKGDLMTAAQIGICATVGALHINVYKKPIVALISTGNELVAPDKEHLPPGKIRDSNKSLLNAACKQAGIERIVDAGIAYDNSDSVLETFTEALDMADIVISTGGVSMGDKDLVKDVLVKDLNCTIHFARMNMKPGKPSTFATCIRNNRKKLLFCLPGNPVSAIVTFNLLVIPSIRKLMGYSNPFHTRIKVKLGFDADLDARPEYHRGILQWANESETDDSTQYPTVLSTGNQHSSRLLSMNQANCLIEIPSNAIANKNAIKKGELLTALLIDKI